MRKDLKTAMVQSMRRMSLMLVLCTIVPGTKAQSPSDIRAYIATYKHLALEQQKKYNIPATITLAQGILESGAGKSGLTRNTNNHFGIKALGGWSGRVYKAWDDESQKSSFRVYSSAAESFTDHSKVLLHSRYSSLFQKSIYDYRGWAIGLQKCGYATAKNYANALIGFIEAYQLYSINGGVKLPPGRTVVIEKTVTVEELIDNPEVQMAQEEESEEERNVISIVHRMVVEINDVRCTILYPGETLSQVSMKYDIPKDKLLEYNETTNEDDINEGDIVFLEKKRKKYTGSRDYYLVREGESLYQVSQQFGIRLSSLIKINDLTLFDSLRKGQKLLLK